VSTTSAAMDARDFTREIKAWSTAADSLVRCVTTKSSRVYEGIAWSLKKAQHPTRMRNEFVDYAARVFLIRTTRTAKNQRSGLLWPEIRTCLKKIGSGAPDSSHSARDHCVDAELKSRNEQANDVTVVGAMMGDVYLPIDAFCSGICCGICSACWILPLARADARSIERLDRG